MIKSLLLSTLLVASVAEAQTPSYIHPDAAAPGMAVYTEIIGPNVRGNFGPDGINKAQVELINPADASRIVVGPSVTSWDGRMISQTFYVRSNASLGPVPFRVITSTGTTAIDNFFIVEAQTIPSNLPPGALGSGGDYGTRSVRNTMVVESLNLGAGTFTVSDVDPDPNTIGNQALLPFTVLSKGPVTINGELTVSGQGQDGIAGGGGAGGRDNTNGGRGYTGGAGTQALGGIGSGADGSGWDGGTSITRTPGGMGVGPRWWDDQGGGGGTGFPFGSGGIAGTWYDEGGWNSPGGIGGGSGGGEKAMPDSSFGGGGGGFATAGGDSGPWNGRNGGRPYGNSLIVPFCGGSGGAAGNQFGDGRGGNGGAGGGAIHIFSNLMVDVKGKISADGADGESTQGVHKSGGGGAGSGGAIAITAPIIKICGELSAKGGHGGAAILKPVEGGLFGGDGGRGRIRLAGFQADCECEDAETVVASNAELKDHVLSGTTVRGDLVKVFLQGPTGTFDFENGQTLTADASGKWSVPLPGNISMPEQISVMQRVVADASNPEDNTLWVLAPVNVVSSSTADVHFAPQTNFNIISASQVGEHIRISITGDPNMNIALKLMDVLGRELSAGSAYIGDLGNANVVLTTSQIPAGHYFVVASTGNAMSTRSVQITR
jgi:hypothetical protein